MTTHVIYNHQCSNCQAFYIPYDLYVVCPNCGVLEGERFDFIPQAIASLKINKEYEGSFTPGAWLIQSLGDHILHILFNILGGFEARVVDEDFGVFLERALSAMNWDGQIYLREHIRGIALKVRRGICTETTIAKAPDERLDGSQQSSISDAPSINLEPSHLRRLIARMANEGWKYRCYSGSTKRKKKCGMCESPLGSGEWVFRREATSESGESWRVVYCCADCAVRDFIPTPPLILEEEEWVYGQLEPPR